MIQGNQYFCYENIVKHSQNVTLFSRSPFADRILHTGPQKSSAKERDIETVTSKWIKQRTFSQKLLLVERKRGNEDVSTTNDVLIAIFGYRKNTWTERIRTWIWARLTSV